MCMIDFGKIIDYLDARATRKYFIPAPGDAFTFIEEDILLLLDIAKKYKFEEVKKLFPPTPGIGLIYNANIKCNECEIYIKTGITKTRFLEYFYWRMNYKPDSSFSEKFHTFKGFICPECEKSKKENQDRENKKSNESSVNTKKINTEDFIRDFLNPCNSWEEGATCSQKIDSLFHNFVNWNEIEIHIKKMHYYEFLKTPYWKAITGKKMKESNYKCQLCNGSGKLSTHHRTYDTHGSELQNMKDLIVLCEPCHAKFHDKN